MGKYVKAVRGERGQFTAYPAKGGWGDEFEIALEISGLVEKNKQGRLKPKDISVLGQIFQRVQTCYNWFVPVFGDPTLAHRKDLRKIFVAGVKYLEEVELPFRTKEVEKTYFLGFCREQCSKGW